MKKSGMLIVALVLFASLALSVSAVPSASSIGTMASNIWEEVISIAKLDWVNGGTGISSENYLTGFMRLAIFLLIFTILFEVATRTAILSRGSGAAVAAIISIISAIFIPGSVLAAIGVTYATIVSLILIGSVIVGGAVVAYLIPPNNTFTRVLRIILLLLLIWILSATIEHAKLLIP